MQDERFSMPDAKPNLLIVEDDADLRVLLTAILSRAGYRVRAVEDGFAALVQIRAHMPDLVLSDLYMLGMSGFELLSVLRRKFPPLTVIAMSSAFSGGEVPDGVAADAFYQKASGVDSLLELLEKQVANDLSDEPEPVKLAAPIWIATHPLKSDSHDRVMIACPECMRTSTHAPGDTAIVVRQTECPFCHAHIEYAIVQTTDPGPPKELWQGVRPASSQTASTA
jgi:CheY-like chemotaxis protein